MGKQFKHSCIIFLLLILSMVQSAGIANQIKEEINKSAEKSDTTNFNHAISKDKDSLDIILANKNYDLYRQKYIEINKKVVFQEAFNDNSRNWYQIENDNALIKVIDGKYQLENKIKDKHYKVWKNIPINQDKDFVIETTVTKLGGNDFFLFGLIWGLSNSSNMQKFYYLGISGNGKYIYGKNVENSWDNIINWTTSTAIRNNSTNKLTVLKSGYNLMIYINDVYVNTTLYSNFFDQNIGFIVSEDIKIEISNLIVTELPGLKELDEKIANTCLNDSNYDSALKYYTMAGYSEKEACFKIAERLYGLNKKDKAIEYCSRANYPVTKELITEVLYDDFIDNRNKWFESDSNTIIKISNGSYNIDYKEETGSFRIFKLITLDPNYDYRIDYTFSKAQDYSYSGFNFYWNVNKRQYYTFGITASGKYSYFLNDDSNWKAIIDYTESKWIRPINEKNKLSLIKTGDKLKFYINGNYVNESPYQKWDGTNIGFYIYKNTKVEIYEISVKQFAPDVVLKLASSVSKKDRLDTIAQVYFVKNDFEKFGSFFNQTKSFEKAGDLYLQSGDTTNAIDFYKKAGKRSNTLLANIYLAQNDFANAVALYTKMNDKQSIKKVAEKCFQNKKYNEAGKYFVTAGEQKRAIEVYHFAAEYYFSKKEYLDAAEYYNKAGERQKQLEAYKMYAESCNEFANYIFKEINSYIDLANNYNKNFSEYTQNGLNSFNAGNYSDVKYYKNKAIDEANKRTEYLSIALKYFADYINNLSKVDEYYKKAGVEKDNSFVILHSIQDKFNLIYIGKDTTTIKQLYKESKPDKNKPIKNKPVEK